MKNLQEMTGQESGIIIHGGDTVIICNWSDADDGIPVLSPLGLPMKWDYGDWEIIEQKRIENIIDYHFLEEAKRA